MSATNRGALRRQDDMYFTPSWCVRRLLEALPPIPPSASILEPCAGEGAIVRQLRASLGPKQWIYGSDLRRTAAEMGAAGASHATGGVDYLAESFEFNSDRIIITNPPYSLAEPIVTKALSEAPMVIMLLRLNWLASESRQVFLCNNPPDVYVLPNRPSFVRGVNNRLVTDATEYAWFVWGSPQGPYPPRTAGRLTVLATTPLEERRLG